jgi:FAD dependent oxidoreductase TIGR03364
MSWRGELQRGRSHSRHDRQRVAVVGAGIVGLAHAWSAAKRGHQVLLFDRHPQACSASIRNFGMVWPIGQPNGPDHQAALCSRALWLEMLKDTGIWHHDSGSLHLAYQLDEQDVLKEFAKIAPALGYDCELLTPNEVLRRSPAARREDLLGGLWSGTELCVDPREVISSVPGWLAKKYRVKLHFATAIEHVSLPWVIASDGSRWQVDRAIVATGADFQTLFPKLLSQAGFRRCKLQMLRTVPQPSGWRIGPMLASGLTLRHYASFRICHSLQALKNRIAETTPELDRYGIHVMAAQNGRGEVVLGDSHEYDDDVTPFDKSVIDELILEQLRMRVDLPDWTIQERWHGIYAQLPGTVQFVQEAEPSVHVVIASGGCGMTMSFGLAEKLWEAWEGDRDLSHANQHNGSVPHAPVSDAGCSKVEDTV